MTKGLLGALRRSPRNDDTTVDRKNDDIRAALHVAAAGGRAPFCSPVAANDTVDVPSSRNLALHWLVLAFRVCTPSSIRHGDPCLRLGVSEDVAARFVLISQQLGDVLVEDLTWIATSVYESHSDDAIEHGVVNVKAALQHHVSA